VALVKPQQPEGGRAALPGQVGFVLGVVAMFVMPLAYQWTFRPATNPLGSAGAVLVVEVLGIAAAAAALLLGRRARAAGERSSGAIWAPRLGAAAMVGYVMTLVLAASGAA
jgi:hypothetical protein